MPTLDGVGFVREQMARKPLPIVILSVANEAGEMVLSALDAGAVDVVQKPTALASDRLLEIGDDLIGKVKAAAEARVQAPASRHGARRRPPSAYIPKGQFDIVVLGISTGGPQALRRLVPQLPAELPVPLAIVLHMPVGYTELYARKLDELSALNVVEATRGNGGPSRRCPDCASWTASVVAPRRRRSRADPSRRPAARHAASTRR